MLRAALLLVRNDLRLFFRDPIALLLSFALPIALVGIFGFIMGAMSGGGGGGGLQPVDVAIRDEDGSPASAAFVQALRESETVRPRFAKEGEFTREQLRARVDEGDDSFALVIPQGFADGADLLLLRDPGRDLEARMVQMGLLAALFEAKGGDAAWELSRRALDQAGLVRVEKNRGVFVRQVSLAEAKVLPSGRNARDATSQLCASWPSSLPVAMSHNRAVSSRLPEARSLPSGANATDVMVLR